MSRWNLLPRTLFSRSLLLLLGLIALAQISTISVYVMMQRPRVIEVARLVATHINTLDAAFAEIPPGGIDAYMRRVNHKNQFRMQQGKPEITNDEPSAPLVKLFVDNVRANLDRNIEIYWSSLPRTCIWMHVHIGGSPYWIMLPVTVSLRYRWLTPVLILSSCEAILAALGAFLIQRRINQPLRDVAQAALNLGNGGHPDRLPRYPVTELASVAEQFNAMMDGLEKMEASRALMLAGISHDIRTPLTKLRLGIAMNQAGEAKLSRYIDQIDAIVGQFLDFARTGADEPSRECDLNAIVVRLAEEFAERGHHFALQLSTLPSRRFRPTALFRLVSNLMDNAVKYGAVGLEVVTHVRRGSIVLAVRDEGPGLQAGDEVRLVQAFSRGDAGRSQVSGSGLGLAIVDRIARLDGGHLDLVRRAPSGLEACVAWPLEGFSPL